jgi:hypothetical protein
MVPTVQRSHNLIKLPCHSTDMLTDSQKDIMGSQLAKELLMQSNRCIGRESNPGLAESSEMLDLMATANFTTKPPMLFDEGCGRC